MSLLGRPLRSARSGRPRVLPFRLVNQPRPRALVLGRVGQVAEWQTRTVQVRVSERTWGFNSPLAHSQNR